MNAVQRRSMTAESGRRRTNRTTATARRKVPHVCFFPREAMKGADGGLRFVRRKLSSSMNATAAKGVVTGPWLDDASWLDFQSLQSTSASGIQSADAPSVKRHIFAAFGPVFDDHLTSYCLDTIYYLPSEQEVREILAATRIGRLAYIDERFDCDDFAFGVKSEFSLYAYEHFEGTKLPILFGVVMGRFDWQRGVARHAACFFVTGDEQRTVQLVEPRQPWSEYRKSNKPAPRTPIDPRDIILRPVTQCRACEFLLF